MSEEKTKVRPPGVAGMFYPAGGGRLAGLIEKLSREEKSHISTGPVSGFITGGIVPHAAIEYCGRQAVHFFDIVKQNSFHPDTVIIIHPNHHGSGPPLSVDDHNSWEVSNGIMETDMKLAKALDIPFSSSAQRGEHSAEVMVPYLLHFLPESVRMVSLNMLDQRYKTAREVARRIFEAASTLERKVLLIASSDFSHFLARSDARIMDDMVLKEITSRNSEGVYRVVMEKNITVCGYGPIMALMEYSAMVDPEYGIRILSRGDSGDIRDSSDVVSYISALFYTKRSAGR